MKQHVNGKEDSRARLLDLIKIRGEISLEEAAESTGLARTTIREHMALLQRDGWITSRPDREGRGRPRLRYRLTLRGQGLYPGRDGVLLKELLGYLAENDGDALIRQFFEHFWEMRYREMEHRLEMRGSTSEKERLTELRHMLEEEGFMPEVEIGENGHVRIRECNCPFPKAVEVTRLPCRLEAWFFETIMGRDMERVSYIPDGHHACEYQFPPGGDD